MEVSAATPAPVRLPNRWWSQVTIGLLVVMELCWIVPWYRTVIEISYVASPLRAALVLGAIMVIAYSLALLLEELRLLHGLQITLQVAVLGLSLVLGAEILLNSPVLRAVNGLVSLDPGAVLVILTVLWLWWRGSSLARSPLRPIVVWRRFILGLIMFLAHNFIVTRMQGQLLDGPPGLGLFTFFLLVSLLAMVFARVAYVGLARGVMKNPFDRRWLASTGLIIVGIVLVAALLGALISGQYSLLLDRLAEVITTLVSILLFVISLPFFIFAYLLKPLAPFFQRLPTPTPTPILTPNPYGQPAGRPALPVVEPAPISPGMQMVIFWGIVLLILAALVIGRRRLVVRKREEAEDFESLLRRGEAGGLLRRAIQAEIDRLAARLRPVKRLLNAARVRRTYALLMILCTRLKHPRPPAATPLEFLPVMGELFPGQMDDLSLITEAYVHVRYGELPEIPADAGAIEAAWRRIAQAGRRLRRSGLPEFKTASELEERDELRRRVV